MLIVLIILTILALMLLIISVCKDLEVMGFISCSGIILLGIVDAIMIFAILSLYSGGINIDKKIEMYQQENVEIQEQITTIVNSYQEYEKETIKSIADMEVLLIKFPELKTSELVKTQMKVYIQNNAKIKELKEKEIDMKLGKWLLYFGK